MMRVSLPLRKPSGGARGRGVPFIASRRFVPPPSTRREEVGPGHRAGARRWPLQRGAC
jgi:hypothetical protein